MGGVKVSTRALLTEPSPSDWDRWEQAILEAILAGDFDANVPGNAARALGFGGSSTFKRSDRARWIEVMNAWRSARDQETRSYVRAGLKQNVERAMQAVPVLDAKGNPTGEFRYDGAVANRGLELLGKQAGMFVEQAQVEVTGADGGPVAVEHKWRLTLGDLADYEARPIEGPSVRPRGELPAAGEVLPEPPDG